MGTEGQDSLPHPLAYGYVGDPASCRASGSEIPGTLLHAEHLRWIDSQAAPVDTELVHAHVALCYTVEHEDRERREAGGSGNPRNGTLEQV